MIPKKRFTDDDLAELKPKPVDENEWILSKYDVPSDCSLKEFIDEKKLIFKRGRAFYEFKNETESITEDQQLILVEIVCLITIVVSHTTMMYSNIIQDGGKYFNLDADPEELREKGLIGEAALQPSLSKFKVLVQSTGLGARHLASGSTLLYVV